MSDITKTVVNGAIDGLEKVADITVTATEEAVGLAASVVKAPINVGEKSAQSIIDEAKGLIAEGLARLRRVADVVTEPLP